MARVRNTFFSISGKLGDKVYKIINGKSYVSRAPEKYTMPMDEASVKRREKFALTMKFANAVTKNPMLKPFWHLHFKTTALCGKVFSFNYPYIKDNSIQSAKLSPKIQFVFTLHSFLLLKNKIEININALNDADIWLNSETQICAAAVMMGIAAEDDLKSRFLCRPLVSLMQPTQLTEGIQFTIHLDAETENLIDRYPSVSLLTALVTLDSSGNPLSISQTVFIQLKNPV